ncbi:hypothetical protein [Siphonobacter aquaeclarae]|uniref:DUF4248 domain-containing protein n=1 Tax=Siphonobacter aquaeclarae TaxID=563176 RepID=A0A1G9T9D2_9BACT|nr:hypothetical protein [Siphonobacter aquaeclarae]SDM44202.1 hypothetical protein SAMN04488090_3465 [Siphonobacter aquaeclarae]
MRKLTDVKTKADLCSYYGVLDWRTLEKQIRPIADKVGLKKGKVFFTPDQVRAIISHLGKPLNPDELYDNTSI